MIRFRLRSQHTGQSQDFTLVDLLNLLGDSTNDEIRFNDGNREEVYNLSSFEDISNGNGSDNANGNIKLVNEAIYFVNGQRIFQIGQTPFSLCMIFLNGIKLRQGIDYIKSDRTIALLYPLQVTDKHTDLLEALYDTSLL